MRRVILLPALFGTCLLAAAHVAGQGAPSPAPAPPCVLVMASFPEELAAIETLLGTDPAKGETTLIHGTAFHTADLGGGTRGVFFLTGMSLVNAAASTQLALERFHPQAVFFTGIAGGVNPRFHPGDVIVPAQWRYHGEAVYCNETAPGKFRLPDWYPHKYANFGMIHPDDVQAVREGQDKPARVAAFPADERLLALARGVAAALPKAAVDGHVCEVGCGGVGVSGSVFCDNAEYRKWVFTTFGADCLDMESTAIAQVCWTNGVPCLIVRGLSDLAGGQPGKNQEAEYLHAAADRSALVLVKVLQAYAAPPAGISLDAARARPTKSFPR